MQIGVGDTWIPKNVFSSGTTWSDALIERLNSVPYSAFRFMIWNGNSGGNRPGPDGPDDARKWESRVQPGELRDGFRISFDDQLELCNRAKIDCWLSVPAQSDQDPTYARKLAQLVMDKLDPELKVYVEWSNESWNYGGYSAKHAERRGTELGIVGDDGRQKSGGYQACGAAFLWSGFDEVFGKDSDRVVRVLSGQLVNAWLTGIHFRALKDPKCNPAGAQPDAYAVAPYVGGGQTTIEGLRDVDLPKVKKYLED